MRVLERDERSGAVQLLVETPEDLYYLALFIRRGDKVYGYTTRQLKIERESGSERGERVKVYLGIVVEKKGYQRFSKTLRLTGRVIDAPETLHIKGAYHTLVVGVGDRIKVVKERSLTRFEELLLERASKHYKRILLLSIDEGEVAVGIVTPIGIDVKAVIPLHTSRREGEKSLRERVEPLLERVLSRILETYDASKFSAIIVAAPEHVKPIVDTILQRHGVKPTRYVKVYEGGEAGIYELVRREDVREIFSEVRREFEEENVDELLVRLSRGDRKIAVGLEEVGRAASWGGVKKLLLLDDLLFDEVLSGRVLKLLDEVYDSAGSIVLISADSEAGEKIKRLGKALAELYFPIGGEDSGS